MKKSLILTSVLALAACHGGSGGGARPGDVTYVDEIGQSNAQITRMVSNSEYQVARYVENKLGDDANLARSATNRDHSGNGMDYDTAHELVELAEWLANDTTTQDDIVSMFNNSNTDKNKIKAALKLLDDMYCFVGGSAETTAERILAHRADFATPLADLKDKTMVFNLNDVTFTMSEITDTADYDYIDLETDEHTGKITGITMIHKGIRGDMINRVGDKVFADSDETVTVDMIGNLRYSDFGYVHTTDIESGTQWDTALAGGYEHYKINKNDMSGEMTFSGRAVGGVNREIGGYDEENAEMIANQPLDTGEGGATLTFNNGAENLVMNFGDWYTVTVSKQANSSTADIRFDADGKTINPDLQVEQTEYADFNAQTYGMGQNGMIGRYDTAFYGVNGDATESTGIVSIRETTGIVGDDVSNVNELSFNSAFGMKKQ